MVKAQDLDIYLKKMTKIKVTLKDMYNKAYVIDDLYRFKKHIDEFHSTGTSIHEENGFYFLVNEKFRSYIKGNLK